uniref:Uncharacterized protein n=1 Tax=Fundulus heteroclitus TaxID=8078 RepID=A0A3Q2R0J3_FUNHE
PFPVCRHCGNILRNGFASHSRKRNVAWLAVLGTAAATAVVGLVAYIILKKKHQKPFTHRKLEEYPADPGRLTLKKTLNSCSLYSRNSFHNPVTAEKVGLQQPAKIFRQFK